MVVMVMVMVMGRRNVVGNMARVLPSKCSCGIHSKFKFKFKFGFELGPLGDGDGE